MTKIPNTLITMQIRNCVHLGWANITPERFDADEWVNEATGDVGSFMEVVNRGINYVIGTYLASKRPVKLQLEKYAVDPLPVMSYYVLVDGKRLDFKYKGDLETGEVTGPNFATGQGTRNDVLKRTSRDLVTKYGAGCVNPCLFVKYNFFDGMTDIGGGGGMTTTSVKPVNVPNPAPKPAPDTASDSDDPGMMGLFD
jgi:hypothetical protein